MFDRGRAKKATSSRVADRHRRSIPVNVAVLLLSACVAGAGQPPAVAPGYAPYPAPAYPYSAPTAQPAPVVVATPGRAYAGDCCGHASVCGDCDGSAHKCCLLEKLKSKLSCIHIDLCGSCNKGCGTCDKGCAPACPPCPKPVCNPCPKPVCNPCPKPECNPCPKPVCNPCPKPVCNPCPKPAPVCCKTETVSHGCSKGCNWTPGYFLHKCKGMLSCCDKGNGCHGGCGTAATPNACGSTVIPPAVAPVNPVPVAPVPVTPATPDLKKMPEKVGSNYGPVQTGQPTSTTTP